MDASRHKFATDDCRDVPRGIAVTDVTRRAGISVGERSQNMQKGLLDRCGSYCI